MQTQPLSKKYFIIGGLLLVAVIFAIISVTLTNQGTPTEDTPEGDYIPIGVIGNPLEYTENDEYSKTLNLYASLDNDMMLSTAKDIISQADAEDFTTINATLYTISENDSEKLTFEVENEEQASYIYNLTYSYNDDKGNSGIIQETQNSQFIHSNGILSDEFKTKSEAIEDYLMRHRK